MGRRLALVAAAAVLPVATLSVWVTAAPLSPPLGPCSGPDCPATWLPPHNGNVSGRDATINVFVGGNYTVQGRAAEVEGKVVTLGDLTVDKTGGGLFNMAVAGVGSRVVPPDGTDFVTVGGNVTVQPTNTVEVGGAANTFGTLAYGNLRYGGTLTGTVNITPAGQAVKDANARNQYANLPAQIGKLSTCAGTATANGTVTVSGNQVTFTGDGTSARQIFNVPGNIGSSTRAADLTITGVPAGATVVINMLGTAPVINTNTGTGLAGDPFTELRSRLMWNFPNATTATIMGGAQFQGSMMAANPAGTTTISTPGFNGRVYLAGNLVQLGSAGTEVHNYPFDGDLPECTTPSPSPSDSTTPTPSPSPSPSPSKSTPSASPSESTPAPSSSTPAPVSSSARPVSSASMSSSGDSQLPATGAGSAAPLGLAAGGLVVTGGVAFWVARRRGRHG
ncbi:choice-of-anchor A family protein [Kitasatospora sp. CMC57]|uniref:choice-of-anchor A family protein n=1 Tax=Kitasatospora sp. CMC57 TaxID=3231513 RepID=UPI0038B64D3B